MPKDTFTIFSLFYLLCGLSFFLFGMKFGEKGLRKIGSTGLKKSIKFLTKNRVFGLISGIIITFLTQSSSATSVMLVGFTNAGLMTLLQTIGILLGSDIGTTLTVQLYSFKIYQLAPFLIAVGFFFFAFSGQQLNQRLGRIVMAFGMVFFGMKMMSDAVIPLQQSPLFLSIFTASVSGTLSAVFVSAIFTSIFQSSAATIAIVLAFALPGPDGVALLDLQKAVPLVLGANIGTCATALLASLKAQDEARRVAWAHTLFKVFGVLIFLPFIKPFILLCGTTSDHVIRQIANAHTIFNISLAVIFLPFVKQYERLINRLFPTREEQNADYCVQFINKNVFKMPALALGQAVREIVRMSGVVTAMVEESILVFKNNDEYQRRRIIKTDDQVDFLHESIMPYIARLSEQSLTKEQSEKAVQLLAITTELEQTADVVSKNLMEHARKKIERGFKFSEEGRQEIFNFHTRILMYLQEAVTAFTLNGMANAREVAGKKLENDVYLEKLRESHMNRLQKGLPETLETTTVHLDLLDDINRINEHAFRIAILVASSEKNV
jgi:phosphate:Na+ symporter